MAGDVGPGGEATAQRSAADPLDRGLDALGVRLSPEQRAQLDQLERLLVEWNRRFNLTAITEHDEILVRHFLDSLSALPLLPARPWAGIDVGSGAGFPGLPIRIARPDARMTLLEATGKKCRFLEAVARELRLDDVEVVNQRAEIQGQVWGYRERYDVAMARGVAPFPVVLELVLPFVKLGGHALCWTKVDQVDWLRATRRPMRMLGGTLADVVDVGLPGLEGHVIAAIQKVDQTPPNYPRRPGIPERRPLK